MMEHSDQTNLRSKSLAPGQWVTVSGTVLLTPRENFVLSIGSQHVRKIGVDHAWIAVHK